MHEKILSEVTFVDIFLNWFWKKSEMMWCDGLGDLDCFDAVGYLSHLCILDTELQILVSFCLLRCFDKVVSLF